MIPNPKLDIKSLVFDMDGTLLNTLYDISYAVNIVLEKYKFPTHSYNDYKRFIGKGIENLIKMALPIDFNGDQKKIASEIKSVFETNLNSKTIIYEGIISILDFLIIKNIKIGICTNKPYKYALKCVDKYFKGYNFKIIGAGYKFPLKPNPSGLNEILNNFEVEPSNCLFIGDSEIDIYTAKNAKTLSVGALWGFRSKKELEKAGADFLFNNPKDFLTFLKKII